MDVSEVVVVEDEVKVVLRVLVVETVTVVEATGSFVMVVLIFVEVEVYTRLVGEHMIRLLSLTDLGDCSSMCCDRLRCLGSRSDSLSCNDLNALIACDRALVLRRIVGDLAIITTEDLLVSGTLLLDRSRIGLPHDDIVTASGALRSSVAFDGQGR